MSAKKLSAEKEFADSFWKSINARHKEMQANGQTQTPAPTFQDFVLMVRNEPPKTQSAMKEIGLALAKILDARTGVQPTDPLLYKGILEVSNQAFYSKKRSGRRNRQAQGKNEQLLVDLCTSFQ